MSTICTLIFCKHSVELIDNDDDDDDDDDDNEQD